MFPDRLSTARNFVLSSYRHAAERVVLWSARADSSNPLRVEVLRILPPDFYPKGRCP